MSGWLVPLAGPRTPHCGLAPPTFGLDCVCFVRVAVIDGKRAAKGMKWCDATAALINYQSRASQPHIDVAQCFLSRVRVPNCLVKAAGFEFGWGGGGGGGKYVLHVQYLQYVQNIPKELCRAWPHN